MKKIVTSVLIIMFGFSATSQQNEFKHQFAKEDYLQENNNYKKVAWHLAGGGAALVLLGLAIHDHEYDSYAVHISGKTAGDALMVYAAVLIPASAVLFIISAKNNNHANANGSEFNLKLEQAIKIQNTNIGYNYYPALSFKITLK